MPDYFNGNLAVATVNGYNTVSDGYCSIWTSYLVFSYTVNNKTYSQNRNHNYCFCGDFSWTAEANARLNNPIGSTLNIWPMTTDPNKLAEQDMRGAFQLFLMFGSVFLAALLVLAFHPLSVLFCGFEACCMRKPCRIYDPFSEYKEIN